MKRLFGSQGPPGWLVTGGMACIALAYVFFAFLPSQKAMKSLRQQLVEQQQFILETDKLFTTVSASHREYEQSSTFNQQWQLAAPDAQQADRLPSRISELANQAGLRILRLEPQAAKPRGLVVEYPILASVEGDFEAIFRFLKAIEELPQTIWLQNVSLHKPGELKGDLRCDLTLTILGDLAEKSD